MPFTLVAFYRSTSTLGWNTLTPIHDPIMRIEGTRLYVPELNKLIGVFIAAEYTSEARIRAPSLLSVAPFYINRLLSGITITNQLHYVDLLANPKAFVPTEPLEVDAYVTDVTAARNIYALLLLGDAKVEKPAGEVWTIKATATGTTTANVWTNLPLTFAETLPAGKYVIIGMKAVHSNMIAARLVSPKWPHRPGVPGISAVTDIENNIFRFGGLGVFGDFEHTTPPTVDLLTKAATTNPIIYFDVVKVA